MGTSGGNQDQCLDIGRHVTGTCEGSGITTSHIDGRAGWWKSPCPDLARGRGGQPTGLLYNDIFHHPPVSPRAGIVNLMPKIARLCSKERTIYDFVLARTPVFSPLIHPQIFSRNRNLVAIFNKLTMPLSVWRMLWAPLGQRRRTNGVDTSGNRRLQCQATGWCREGPLSRAEPLWRRVTKGRNAAC